MARAEETMKPAAYAAERAARDRAMLRYDAWRRDYRLRRDAAWQRAVEKATTEYFKDRARQAKSEIAHFDPQRVFLDPMARAVVQSKAREAMAKWDRKHPELSFEDWRR